MTLNARLAVNSVTYAMQAKDLLAKYGIETTVSRLHRDETPSGCAFGLEISRQKLPAAVDILRRAQIEFKNIGR